MNFNKYFLINFNFLIFCTIFNFTLNAKTSHHTYYKSCNKNDPGLNECVRLSIEDALIKVKDGEPRISLNSVDPLEVLEIDIPKTDGPVGIRQAYYNLNVYGLTNSKLSNTKVDLEKKTIYTETMTPKIELIGKYEIDGNILILPIQGKGPCNITMSDVKTTHLLTSTTFEKNGKTHWKTHYDLKLYPKNVHFLFEDLFNGDKELGDRMYEFANRHWREIFDEVKPAYEETFSLIFESVANKLFSKIPIDDIFTD